MDLQRKSCLEFYLILVILGLFIAPQLIVSESYMDEDTIVIEANSNSHGAAKSRTKRQTLLINPMLSYLPQNQQTPAEYRFQNPGNGAVQQQQQAMPVTSSSPTPCITTKKVMGQCVKMEQCFPNFNYQNQDLVNLYLRTSEFCPSTTNTNVPQNNFLNQFYGFQNQQQQQQNRLSNPSSLLVCCTSKPAGNAQNHYIPKSNHPNSISQNRKWKSLDMNSVPMHYRKMMPANVEPVPIQKYPWTVAIMQGDRHHCGGSLLNKFTVITAAHCVYNLDSFGVANLRVLLGHHDISNSMQGRTQAVVRKVIKSIFHREFSMRTLHNDIALLILEFSVPMENNVNISPVRINTDPEVNGQAFVAGWGALGWNLPPTPQLMQTTIDIWSNRKCAAMYGHLAPGGITSKMICGSAVGKDACRGDSGGPLMVQSKYGGDNFEQIGVVSWGIECGKYPSVHTRLSSYYTWILKNKLD